MCVTSRTCETCPKATTSAIKNENSIFSWILREYLQNKHDIHVNFNVVCSKIRLNADFLL